MRDSPPGGGWSDGTGLGKVEIEDQSKSPKFLIFKDLRGGQPSALDTKLSRYVLVSHGPEGRRARRGRLLKLPVG